LTSKYYKELFGPGDGNMFDLDLNLWLADENVTMAENEQLTKPFSENEIKCTLFQMEKNKAAGPDGMPIEFFQACWGFMKSDMIDVFKDFYEGTLNIKRLNYGIITLLPKVKGAEKIQQYRPICLVNCLYKWITKCLTSRLEAVAGRIIHKAQTAFLKGRNIMNGVLPLHEILHETKKQRKTGVVLKLDFEKAYDKVHWGFLLRSLEIRGFSSTWCAWIKKVLENGTLAVKVNNTIGPYFSSHKGVRQGDPLSPILFNLAAEILTRMIYSAQQNGLVTGLVSNKPEM
jgi:hypothetical protein